MAKPYNELGRYGGGGIELVLAIVLIKPQLMRSASFDAAHAVASYFFIAWPHPKFAGMFWPVVVPGWTLDYEMFFYAIVTVSLAFALRWRPVIICAVLVALTLLGTSLAPMTIGGFYTDPILLEFALGIVIGVCFTRRSALPRGVAYALIVLGLGLFVVLGPLETEANRLMCWGMPMALLVLGSVNAPTILPGRRTGGCHVTASTGIGVTPVGSRAPAVCRPPP